MQQERNGLTAAAGPPLIPSREWFEMEEPQEPTGWTVTADGQVFGHAALWDTCHTGKPGRCVTPPKSRSQYAFYQTGLTEVDDGELIPTGRITLGTGHASLTASPAATAEHYDNTGAVVADVTIRDGRHGIWVSGALRPNVPPERIRELRGASLSGDWRSIRGKLEMLGLLAVNVPGFPVPRAMTASGEGDEILALVAAGVLCADDDGTLKVLQGDTENDEEIDEEFKALYASMKQRSEKVMSRKEKVATVMREFKAGKLKSSSGDKVTDRKQALAIALSEARSLRAAAPGDPGEAGKVHGGGGTVSGDLMQGDDLTAAGARRFDPGKHPREPKGTKKGGQWAVKTVNREGVRSTTEWGTQEQAEFDYKGVRDRTPFVEKGQLVNPAGETVSKFDRYEGARGGDHIVLDAAERDRRSRESAEAYEAELRSDPSTDPALDTAADRRRRSEARQAERYGTPDIAQEDFYSGLPDHTLALILKTPPKDANERAIHKIVKAEMDKRAQGMIDSFLGDLKAAAEPECTERSEPHPFDITPASALTASVRAKLAAQGVALPDGSLPIRQRYDLPAAITAAATEEQRAWVAQRAAELGAIHDLPATWDVESLLAAGTFDETKHPRHSKGSDKGGEFAPKGTSKIAPRPDEAGAGVEHRRTMGGKLVQGPGGKMMSRTEAGELLDKEREGEKFDIDKERANIERRVKEGALTTSEGQELTERAWEKHQRDKAVGSPSDLNYAEDAPPEGWGERDLAIQEAADGAAMVQSSTEIGSKYNLSTEEAAEAWRRAQARFKSEGRAVDLTDQYDI